LDGENHSRGHQAGTSAVWKYKGIYQLNGQHVGQWSDVAAIGVMG
jgi:hypothetical protein